MHMSRADARAYVKAGFLLSNAMVNYYRAQELRSWAITLNKKADEHEEISWRFLMIAGERGELDQKVTK
jgi:hypothetical protein